MMKAIVSWFWVVALGLAALPAQLKAQYPAAPAPVVVQAPGPAQGQAYAPPSGQTPVYGPATQDRRPRLHNPFREVVLINPFTGQPLTNPFKNKRLMTGQEIKENVGGFFSRVFRRPATAPAPAYQAPVYQAPVYATPGAASVPVYQTAPQGSVVSSGQATALPDLAADALTPSPTPSPPPQAPVTAAVKKPKVTQSPPAYPALPNPAAQSSTLPKSGVEKTEAASSKPVASMADKPVNGGSVAPSTASSGGGSVTAPAKPPGGYPVGKKTPRAGRVTSPYPPYRELDVSDLASGAMALDPITRKIFIVP